MSSSAEIVLIPEEGVSMVWSIAAPLLKKGVDRTKKISLNSLHDSMCEGMMQLWLAYDPDDKQVLAACATEIVNYESGYRTVRILILGGFDVNRWSGCIATIEEWALYEGCDAVEIAGRAGWGRIYEDYRPIEHWFAKEIN